MIKIENAIKEYLYSSTKDEQDAFFNLKHLLKGDITVREIRSINDRIFQLLLDENISPNMQLITRNYKFNSLLLENALNKQNLSEVYFSPGDDCANAIIEELQNAQKSVDICVFTISDNIISREILKCHKRGISTRIITDDQKIRDKGSDINSLFHEGISIKTDRSSHFMHDKFAVFDKDTVITGSFNWTRSASKYNQENILLSKNQRVVKAFTKEFNHLWDRFETLGF